MASQNLKHVTKLQGSRVLVFGGTSGIGFGVAKAALEYGATVCLSGSSPARLDKSISRLREGLATEGSPLVASPDPAQVMGKTCDLLDLANLEANVEDLLRFATNEGSDKLDHVVFTAGDSINIKPISENTIEDMQKSMTIRFIGCAVVAKFLPRYVKATVTSSYTLTGGSNSWKPSPNWSILAGVGAGVEGLARGLAVDIKPIRVNAVQVGAVKTELWGSVTDKVEAMVDMYRKQTVTDTVGTPEDLAEAYLYCMKGTFTSGSTVVCDGGRLIV